MSEYSGIRGTRVKYLASDPTLNTSTEGQVWYNSTSSTLKSLVQIKATSSGANMSTARGVLGGAGTQTAALGFGGYTWTPPAVKNSTEEYSGYSWNNGGNMGTARSYPKGCGTQTAALAFGGDTTNLNNETGATEEYDGSAWTAGGSLNTSRYNIAPAGIQTAAIGAGGYKSPASPQFVTNAESYDGSSWTAITAMPESKAWAAGAGTQTAALISGGSTPPVSATSLLWNGSAWTAGGTMNTARSGIAGAGLSTAAIVYGNSTSNVIEEYDGSVWTTSPATMSNSLFGRNSATNGTISAGLMFSGTNPPSTASAATEEYNSNINAFTAAVWTSGGNMPKPKYNQAGAGTQTAALSSGGYNFTDNDGQPSIEYDGTSWGNSAPLRAGSDNYAAGFGTQTAGVVAGGFDIPVAGGTVANTEEYNGSSWTTANNMNTARFQGGSGGSGILTAGLVSGGRIYETSSNSNAVEEYDGTDWTSGGNLPIALHDGTTFGTQTASVYVGGTDNLSPNVSYSHTLLYDGSSWTSGNNFFRPNFNSDGGGTQTSAVMCGGRTSAPGAGPPPFTTAPVSGGMTAEWDGSNWISTASLSNFRQGASMAKNGTTSAGLVFGGNDGSAPGSFSATEEYTSGTETVTASTLTTS